MWYLVLGIIVLGAVSAVIGLSDDRRRRRRSPEADVLQASPPDCCGRHEVCERDRRFSAVREETVYYDDEELDVYRGTAPDGYKEQEIEAFRETLYTLREPEVAGWLQSLQRRNINLPEALKDEALLIVEEQRWKSSPRQTASGGG